MPMLDAFRRADDVLLQAVRGISDLIVHTGTINVDFADVKTIMSANGRALMGTGYGRGDSRALDAAEMAVNSPLLDDISIEGATGILINFIAGPDIKAKEIHDAASLVQQAAHEDANIIFGLVTDPDMGDVVKVTVIATGFDMQPAAENMQLRKRLVAPGVATGVPVGVRAAAQQVLRTSSMPAARPSAPAQAHHAGDAPRRSVSVPAHLGIDPRIQSSRPFGGAAIPDEATLEIPAYMRRPRT